MPNTTPASLPSIDTLDLTFVLGGCGKRRSCCCPGSQQIVNNNNFMMAPPAAPAAPIAPPAPQTSVDTSVSVTYA